ncbi:MAG: hypothetical protein M3296_09640 [Actinomycetota bacterium]|nr:hypothetical protein [Actinomycetota bacterium]
MSRDASARPESVPEEPQDTDLLGDPDEADHSVEEGLDEQLEQEHDEPEGPA